MVEKELYNLEHKMKVLEYDIRHLAMSLPKDLFEKWNTKFEKRDYNITLIEKIKRIKESMIMFSKFDRSAPLDWEPPK